ncbi:MAG: elongation factor 4 [Candidatus Marinimicrobia bacterium]|nr:elongation factor 4 [Candidatus Neomarinimicrobiota bacterium]|tara:strand:- start:28117 stop:29922 length:1806 start_codon:yes stop_codon:yes gene_type:complete
MSDRTLKIRNFCIIAHIDHGKSTLADRMLELTDTVNIASKDSQVLDDMDLEKERGITIKSHPIQMNFNNNGKQYILNLIDTPGHVDFTYEVSRSMAACEGALLLIDSTQGVEAQTVSNTYLALDSNLEIIPVLNKIDMKNSNIEDTKEQVCELLGVEKNKILSISAKSGEGVEDVFSSIIEEIPAPESSRDDKLKALIFDSYFDQYRGVVVYVRIVSGSISKKTIVKFFKYQGFCEVVEVGILKIKKEATDSLSTGDVGYIVLNIKDVSKVKVGDTITDKNDPVEYPLDGYKPIKPMVFSGLYPIDSKDFEDLRLSLDKLKLNDSSLSYEANTSTALGFGFRCGFLGPLHMEIIQERLEREFDLDLISTCPNVIYKVELKDGEVIKVSNPSDLPDSVDINSIYEPFIKAEIISPKDFIGSVMSLCTTHRGTYISTHYLSSDKVQMVFEMPLAEIIFDFFEKLKSSTKGYASLDYEMIDDRVSKLVKLDIKVAGDIVDALSIIVHNKNSYNQGSKLCKRLKEEIHRQQFEIPIQAVIGNKVIARETVKALRKNVTAKCYGGDISRKRKLLEKQKKGKKRMKQIGNVELPQSAFLAILKSDNE